MSLDGIWSIEVASIEGWTRAGVLAINDGEVVGGSRNYYTVGSAKASSKGINITMDSHIFGEITPLFGTRKKRYALVLQGKRRANQIKGTMSEVGNSKFSVPYRLTRLADLP